MRWRKRGKVVKGNKYLKSREVKRDKGHKLQKKNINKFNGDKLNRYFSS